MTREQFDERLDRLDRADRARLALRRGVSRETGDADLAVSGVDTQAAASAPAALAVHEGESGLDNLHGWTLWLSSNFD